MVKVTSSMIDIYTVPNTAPLQRRQLVIEPEDILPPHSSTLPRKELRRFSMDAGEFLSDSSDSETSFFDDSDDNDDVTVFFGKHGSRYRNFRDGDATSAREYEAMRRKKQSIANSCEMLASPRLNRKGNKISHSKTTSNIHRSATDDAFFGSRPPVRNFSVPNLSAYANGNRTTDCNTKKARSESPTSEEEIVQRNSYLLSPRMKRKQQVDITKSAAFKEIYAHNLRLYSAVLAKQVASSGQVGREMNEIRRNKIKERAMGTQETAESKRSVYKRSKSFATGSRQDSTLNANKIRGKRSNSASSDLIRSQIQNATFMGQSNLPLAEKSNSDDDLRSVILEECCDEFRGRSMSLAPTKDILSRISTQPIIDENQNEVTTTSNNNIINEQQHQRSERSVAASRRKEQLQRKLESFDIMLDKTSDFLAKVKTMRKS